MMRSAIVTNYASALVSVNPRKPRAPTNLLSVLLKLGSSSLEYSRLSEDTSALSERLQSEAQISNARTSASYALSLPTHRKLELSTSNSNQVRSDGHLLLEGVRTVDVRVDCDVLRRSRRETKGRHENG